MTDFQIFDPYFSEQRHENKLMEVSEYADLLFYKLQNSLHFNDFPQLQIVFDTLLTLKMIDNLQLFSLVEKKKVQECLRALIFQCKELSISTILKELKELLESAKGNSRSEIVILFFAKIAPKSFGTTLSLEKFSEKIRPILEHLPKLRELEVGQLRKQLDRIWRVYQKNVSDADKELVILIQKYLSA